MSPQGRTDLTVVLPFLGSFPEFKFCPLHMLIQELDLSCLAEAPACFGQGKNIILGRILVKVVGGT